LQVNVSAKKTREKGGRCGGHREARMDKGASVIRAPKEKIDGESWEKWKTRQPGRKKNTKGRAVWGCPANQRAREKKIRPR